MLRRRYQSLVMFLFSNRALRGASKEAYLYEQWLAVLISTHFWGVARSWCDGIKTKLL